MICLPSWTAVISTHFRGGSIGNNIDTAFVDNCDAPEGLTDLGDSLWIGMNLGGYITPLEN